MQYSRNPKYFVSNIVESTQKRSVIQKGTAGGGGVHGSWFESRKWVQGQNRWEILKTTTLKKPFPTIWTSILAAVLGGL